MSPHACEIWQVTVRSGEPPNSRLAKRRRARDKKYLHPPRHLAQKDPEFKGLRAAMSPHACEIWLVTVRSGEPPNSRLAKRRLARLKKSPPPPRDLEKKDLRVHISARC